MTHLSPIDPGQRRLEPEIMDQPGLATDDHLHALAGLARINRLSRVDRILWPEIASLAARGRTLRVLDLASGGGDVLIRVARRAARRGLAVEFLGLDMSPVAVDVARQRTAAASLALKQDLKIEFSIGDVLGDSLPQDFDIVMCSLFLHHLTEDAAQRFLERMRDAARQKLLVSDLVRSRPGYWLAQVACRLFSRSYVVRIDGPASIQAAFSIDEARRLAERAGLAGARLTRHWPQRYLLAWSRG